MGTFSGIVGREEGSNGKDERARGEEDCASPPEGAGNQ